jgi:hypothetical protein
MKLTRILPVFASLAVACLIAVSSGAVGDLICADFNYEIDGKKVSFTDDSLGLNIQSWYWDFGDREYSTDKNPVHEYSGFGKYKVVLEVISATGNISFKIQNVTLERSGVQLPSVTLGEVFAFSLIALGFFGLLVVRSPYSRLSFGVVLLLGVLSLVYIWS